MLPLRISYLSEKRLNPLVDGLQPEPLELLFGEVVAEDLDEGGVDPVHRLRRDFLVTDASLKENVPASVAFIFLDGPTPASFSFIFANGIRTQIIRVEGEGADH